MPRKQDPEKITRLADMLSAMGTEPRLRIMQLLLSAHPEGMVVGDIGSELEIPSSTLSHHLDKLKNEDLVKVRREGTFLWYTANTEALQELLGFLYAECCTRNKAVKPENGIVGALVWPENRRAMSTQSIKEVVKEKYGEAALRIHSGGSSCCGASAALDGCCDPITSDLYDAAQALQIPEDALKASLGCGNPTALAQLNAGETVLDLGSGGGIDRAAFGEAPVGPTGKAYGLDMTDEMLALARANQTKAGVENVEFLKGEIESIPLPDNSVDVIISNCVINLSADKDRVLSEAFRVLKPGGRFAVSDVVVHGDVPQQVRDSVLLWVGCIAGALQDSEYADKLAVAGFEAIEIEPTRIYRAEDARAFLTEQGIDVDAIAPQMDGKFRSAFIRARKPQAVAAKV